MKALTPHTHHLRSKKRINYSNYHFVLALYTIYKKESKNEVRLPVHNFRNRDLQKQSGTASLKQKLGRYLVAVTNAIASVVFKKEKPIIIDQHIA